MLEPYTVLDFTDDRGEIAGMILGDLGANVIGMETTCNTALLFRETSRQPI